MVEGTPDSELAYADDSWVAGTLEGLEIPGWIVLALRRHAVDAAPIGEEEARRLGPAIRTISTAIVDSTDAERIYLQAYGEKERHWHLLISPRGPSVPAEHRHTALFGHRNEYLDPAESKAVLTRVREAIRAQPVGD